MSELSLRGGGRRRKEMDSNVTFFGYVAKDKVRKLEGRRMGERRRLSILLLTSSFSLPSSTPPPYY